MSNAINISSRMEPLFDDYLVEEMHKAFFVLHKPERREVVFTCSALWEDDVAGFNSVFQDGERIRLYYRAAIPERSNEDRVIMAIAESDDGGLSFYRPDIGLVEFDGSKSNNILYYGEPPFVPPPAFIDTNPACKPGQRYKGLSSSWQKLYAMCSQDGYRWRPLSTEPISMEGTFDTINTAFWDRVTGKYRCYTRYFENFSVNPDGSGTTENDVLGIEPTVVRAIQSATSEDFLIWSPVTPNRYNDPHADMQLYTNNVLPCPGAEHIYLSFPNRYVQQRVFDPGHGIPGVNDALFMVSRNGLDWKRYAEAWVRPGLDTLNWTDRNNYPVWGIIETSPLEWSMYISEHYRHPGIPVRLRRLSIRPWGFVSIRAGFDGGELITKPLSFTGRQLCLNYSTSAAGTIRVELQDEQGYPIEGFSLGSARPIFGDQLCAPVYWNDGADVSRLEGVTVRLRVVLNDADIYTLRFT